MCVVPGVDQGDVEAGEDRPSHRDQDAAGEGGPREAVRPLLVAEEAPQRGDEEQEEHHADTAGEIAEQVGAVVGAVVVDDLDSRVVDARGARGGEGHHEQHREDDPGQGRKAPERIRHAYLSSD